MINLTKISLKKKTVSEKQELIDTISSHLYDSYFLLDIERPDMAFSHLWKAINGGYNKLIFKAYKTLHKDYKYKNQVSDSSAIKFLLMEINSYVDKSDIYDFIKGYASIFPEKQAKYIANTILKGFVLHKSALDPIFKNHHYSKNIRKNYEKEFVTSIEEAYGLTYLNIITCDIIDGSVVFSLRTASKSGIKETEEELKIKYNDSRQIIGSLAIKIRQLIKEGKTEILAKDQKTNNTISLSDEVLLDFLFRGLLYTTRNTNVHGNTISRYASKFMNPGTVLSSKYIYFLGHFFLTVILLLTGDLSKKEFITINRNNLSLAQETLS